MKKLVYITTSFEPGAIPNIFSEILPFIINQYTVNIVVFEKKPHEYAEYTFIKKLGVSFYFLNRRKWDILGTYLSLKKCINEIAPDIIHSHLGRADIITAFANRNRIPHVATFHSVRTNFSTLTLTMLKLSDRYISFRTGVSQVVIQDFYQNAFLKSPHRVIYNPISFTRISIKQDHLVLKKQYNIPDNAYIIGCIGRMVQAKGHHFLLEAFAKVCRSYTSMYLILAGDGPLYGELKNQAKALAIEDRIRWLGFYTPASDIINLCNVVVFPSLWEGMGLVPLESVLLRRPVIASDLPVLHECIPEGIGVKFVKAGNVEELAWAIESMLQHDQSSFDSYFNMAIPIITNRYKPESIALAYMDIYTLICSKNDRGK